MFENTLSNWFYILGIGYFVISFLLLVGLAVFFWVIYQRLSKLQTTLLANIISKKRTLLSVTKIAPLLMTFGVNQFLKRRK